MSVRSCVIPLRALAEVLCTWNSKVPLWGERHIRILITGSDKHDDGGCPTEKELLTRMVRLATMAALLFALCSLAYAQPLGGLTVQQTQICSRFLGNRFSVKQCIDLLTIPLDDCCGDKVPAGSCFPYCMAGNGLCYHIPPAQRPRRCRRCTHGCLLEPEDTF